MSKSDSGRKPFCLRTVLVENAQEDGHYGDEAYGTGGGRDGREPSYEGKIPVENMQENNRRNKGHSSIHVEREGRNADALLRCNSLYYEPRDHQDQCYQKSLPVPVRGIE